MKQLIFFTLFFGFMMPIQGMHKLIRRAGRAVGSRTVRVGMRDGAYIVLPAQEKESIEIKTAGLIGCIACGVYIREKTGRQAAILTHYPVSETDEHILALIEHIQVAPINDAIEKVGAIIAVAGTYEPELSETIRYIGNFYSPLVSDLKGVLQRHVVHKARQSDIPFTCKVVPYGNLPPVGKSYYCADMRLTLSNNKKSLCKISNIGVSETIDL